MVAAAVRGLVVVLLVLLPGSFLGWYIHNNGGLFANSGSTLRFSPDGRRLVSTMRLISIGLGRVSPENIYMWERHRSDSETQPSEKSPGSRSSQKD